LDYGFLIFPRGCGTRSRALTRGFFPAVAGHAYAWIGEEIAHAKVAKDAKFRLMSGRGWGDCLYSSNILIGQGVLDSVNDFLGGVNIIENSSKGGG
jgi:hypothetical protein